jgi:hypothetical protein
MAGFVIVGLVTVAVLVVAIRLGLHVDPENAPHGSPGWTGPDATALDAALGELIQELRTPPPARLAALDELAAHHAFDMAMRRFDGERTPEGEGLEGRHLRLHPEVVGEAAQWQELADVDAGWSEPARVLDALVGPDSRRGTALREPLRNHEIGEIGVGAAVEKGRVALCVVMMSRWATLDDTEPPPAHDGCIFRGELGPGVEADQLKARFRREGGPWSEEATAIPEDVGHLEADQPRRFRLVLPIPMDGSAVDLQFVRGGVHGRTRRLG